MIPAKNEAGGLSKLLPGLRAAYPKAQIIVSDDGSTDNTSSVAREVGVEVVSSPYSMGNGAAIKRGVGVAAGDVLVMMDGDGQHLVEDIDSLLKRLDDGFDMVVGARNREGQANVGRGLANALYNRLASWMTGQTVRDLTSGFRVARADKFREFMHLYPNGFSYPTTSTMAFFRSAYPVAYVPINVQKRIGRSHIRPFRDGVRFLLIIFKIATLYSPVKLFAPAAAAFFLTGLGYYGWTYATQHRFSNMSLLLFSASVIIFLIGLVSEQITSLNYRRLE
ncbi:MAG: glycosyltransferase family 2 protein [Rhodanobacteraceae bacterium]|nr:glycosyltransferase family 2 protein [Rhodanobacteraceae bacterium]